MKKIKIFMLMIAATVALGACSGNKTEGDSDSSTMGTMEDSTGMATDSLSSDTTVKPADSTTSYRNDRGTDSVSAGKSVPQKP